MEFLLSKSDYSSVETDLGSTQGGGYRGGVWWGGGMNPFHRRFHLHKQRGVRLQDKSTMVCSLMIITVVDNSCSPHREFIQTQVNLSYSD